MSTPLVMGGMSRREFDQLGHGEAPPRCTNCGMPKIGKVGDHRCPGSGDGKVVRLNRTIRPQKAIVT